MFQVWLLLWCRVLLQGVSIPMSLSKHVNSAPVTLTMNNEGYYVDNSVNLHLVGESFSILFWVYIEEECGGLDTPLFASVIPNQINTNLHIVLRDAHPYFGFGENDLQGHSILQQKTWYHLGFVYDSLKSLQRIYVNGELDIEAWNNSQLQGNCALYIGMYQLINYQIVRFHGRISQLKIYPTALTDSVVGESMFAISPYLISIKGSQDQDGSMTNNWSNITPAEVTDLCTNDKSLGMEIQSRNPSPVYITAILEDVIVAVIIVSTIFLIAFTVFVFAGKKLVLEALLSFSNCSLQLVRYLSEKKNKMIRIELDESDEENTGTELNSFTANNDRESRALLSVSSRSLRKKKLPKEDLEDIRPAMIELNNDRYHEIMCEAVNRDMVFDLLKRNPVLSQEFLLYPEDYRVSYLKQLLQQHSKGLILQSSSVSPATVPNAEASNNGPEVVTVLPAAVFPLEEER